MAYLTHIELEKMNFKKLGTNVKISSKASIYDTEKMEIGDNSRVDDFCVISGLIRLGCNVHIAPMCLLAGGRRGIFMEDFSALAYGVKVFTQTDDYSGKYLTNPTVPSQYTKPIGRAIYIGKHVIVGTNSVLLPGCKIEEGVSVGAISLVQGTLKKWKIYSGMPAIELRERSKDLLELETVYVNERKK